MAIKVSSDEDMGRRRFNLRQKYYCDILVMWIYNLYLNLCKDVSHTTKVQISVQICITKLHKLCFRVLHVFEERLASITVNLRNL